MAAQISSVPVMALLKAFITEQLFALVQHYQVVVIWLFVIGHKGGNRPGTAQVFYGDTKFLVWSNGETF